MLIKRLMEIKVLDSYWQDTFWTFYCRIRGIQVIMQI